MPCDYNHLALYTKGWYQRSDNVLNDIRRIISHRSNIEAQYVSNRDVWENVVTAYLYFHPHLHQRTVCELLMDLFKPDPRVINGDWFWTDSTTVTRAVQIILGQLSTMKVFEGGVTLLELGQPDPAVLPLNEQAKALWAARHP